MTKEKRLEYYWDPVNHASILEQKRAYYDRKRSKVLESNRRWRQENKATYKQIQRRRRKRKKENG